MQNGENISTEELKAFILSAENDLVSNRIKAAAPKPVAPKATNVDFF